MSESHLKSMLQGVEVSLAGANDALAREFLKILAIWLEGDGVDVRHWLRHKEVPCGGTWDVKSHRELYLSRVAYATWWVRLLYWPVQGLVELPFVARTATDEAGVVQRLEIGDVAVAEEAKGLMQMLRSLPRHADARVLLTLPGNPQKDIADE